jgi:hypothetical protein
MLRSTERIAIELSQDFLTKQDYHNTREGSRLPIVPSHGLHKCIRQDFRFHENLLVHSEATSQYLGGNVQIKFETLII